MTHDQRVVREQQLRILLACGERGPVLQQLFGVSARTIKRLVRQTAMPVSTGRAAAPTRGWLGRDRRVVEQLLQRWLYDGLEKLLAGEAPTWLDEMARQAGLRSAAAIAAMVQRIEVQEGEPREHYGGAAVARILTCATCHTPLVIVQREGVQRGGLPQCPNPACPRSGAASARIARLEDWRRRRAHHEEQR
jgi:hypothetical protein